MLDVNPVDSTTINFGEASKLIQALLVLYSIMLIQLSALTFSKFSVFCLLLSGTLLLTNATQVTAKPPGANGGFREVLSQAPSQEIDFYTDHFFYQANPELGGRKLTANDRDYIREWDNLRAAIAPFIKPTEEACPFEQPDGRWEFDLNAIPRSYQSAYDYLADVIFYSRYPQMLGEKLTPGTVMAQRWSVIRQRLYVSTCGL